MGYKSRNRKSLKLPSGATAEITRLSLFKVMELGSMPGPVIDEGRTTPKRTEEEFSQDNVDRGVKLARLALSSCVNRFEYEGEQLKIVDKPASDTTSDELSIDDLDQADAEALFDEISGFSGLGKEVGAKVRPFPQEQKAGPGGSCDREDLQGSPHRGHEPVSARI